MQEHSTFTDNREQRIDPKVTRKLLRRVVRQARCSGLPAVVVETGTTRLAACEAALKMLDRLPKQVGCMFTACPPPVSTSGQRQRRKPEHRPPLLAGQLRVSECPRRGCTSAHAARVGGVASTRIVISAGAPSIACQQTILAKPASSTEFGNRSPAFCAAGPFMVSPADPTVSQRRVVQRCGDNLDELKLAHRQGYLRRATGGLLRRSWRIVSGRGNAQYRGDCSHCTKARAKSAARVPQPRGRPGVQWGVRGVPNWRAPVVL